MAAMTQDPRDRLQRGQDRPRGLAVVVAVLVGALAGVVMADEGAAIATAVLGVALAALAAMAVPAVRRRGRRSI